MGELDFYDALRDSLPPDVEENLRKYRVLKKEVLEELKKRGHLFPGTTDIPEHLQTDLLKLCGLIGALAKPELPEK